MSEHLKSKWPFYVGGVILFLIILFEAQGRGDFSIFLQASSGLWQKQNVYTTIYNEWYHYYYGVFFALILSPFTLLPLYVAKVIWLCINVFFVYRIWKILSSWLPLDKLSKISKTIFVILSFVFISRFLRDNFHLSQVTIFILYLTLEGLYLISKEKHLAGALLIALGIDTKLLPIVIIPYLLYRGEWRALLYVFLFIAVFLFMPSLFIGHDFNITLLQDRWLLLNPANQTHILDTSERSFHSLTTLLATLLVENSGDVYALPIKRNIADISIEKLNLVINACRVILVALTLYFLETMPFKKSKSQVHRLYEISYLCLIVPLIFPHQQHYAFFFIFPAITYLLYYTVYLYFNKETLVVSKNFKMKKMALVFILFLIYFLTNGHLILGEFNRYYDHFKTLTYGALMVVVVLAACRPKKLLLGTTELPSK
ncbi:MAG: glycosyltransferase family 87 protein [Bacteroidota bacterium]|nr:glycosyltransferase family 87 protein [Bacteroidota bacterium]